MTAAVSGTYNDAATSNGQGLSDYMLFCSATAAILVIVNTAQVNIKLLDKIMQHFRNFRRFSSFKWCNLRDLRKCFALMFDKLQLVYHIKVIKKQDQQR